MKTALESFATISTAEFQSRPQKLLVSCRGKVGFSFGCLETGTSRFPGLLAVTDVLFIMIADIIILSVCVSDCLSLSWLYKLETFRPLSFSDTSPIKQCCECLFNHSLCKRVRHSEANKEGQRSTIFVTNSNHSQYISNRLESQHKR